MGGSVKTTREIEQAIIWAYRNELTAEYPNRNWSGRLPWSDFNDGETLNVPDLGEVRWVKQIHHGDEDSTGRVQQILQVGDTFYCKWGMYYSHSGMEWEDGDFTEVTRKEKVVTVVEWS